MNEQALWQALGVALLFASLPLSAQAQEAARPSTLSEAIERASAVRLEARLGAVQVTAARARLKAAWASHYPQLGFSVDFRRIQRWDNFTGVTAEAMVPGYGPVQVDVSSSTPRNQIFPRLEANYDLYAGGRYAAGVRQAELQERSAQLDRHVIRQRIMFEVSSTWLKWRSRCIDWSSADAEAALSQRQLDLASQRHRAGRLSDIDWHAAQVAHEEKLRMRENRAEAVHSAYAEHAASIDNQPRQSVSVAGICRFKQPLRQDIGTALAPTFDSEVSRRHLYDIDIAREQVQIEKAADRPTVSLIAQYGHGARHDRYGELLPNMRRQEALIGIRVSWNLFDGFLSEARADAARADLERRRLERELHLARQKRRQQEGVGRQRDAGLAIALAQSRIELAIARRALAEERQRSGRANQLAVQESHVAEQLARNALDQAEIDQALARLEWQHADMLADVQP